MPSLHRLDFMVLGGIPTATVARVLLDLAPRLSPPDLGRACHEGWIRGATPRMVKACIARNPRRPGMPRLLAALGADVTLSVLEDAFLALLPEHGLLRPRTNIDRRGDKADLPLAADRPHRRARELPLPRFAARLRGGRRPPRRSNHIAFSYGDVFERGAQTIAELIEAISRRGAAAAQRPQTGH